MQLDYQKLNGILPAVVQDARTHRILMVGFMNGEAFRLTVETGRVVFYSRSREKLWTKGETSGHFLLVREIVTDCDGDTLLIQAEPAGPGACHQGYESCFHWRWNGSQWEETEPQKFDPASVYEGSK